jgi:PAS domain S-box-containing protein
MKKDFAAKTRQSKLHQSSTYQLVLAIALLVVVVLIVSTVALERLKTQTLEKTQTNLSTLLNITSESLELWIQRRKQSIQGIAKQPCIIANIHTLLALPRDDPWALSNAPAQAQVRAILEPRIQQFNDLGMFVIAPDYTNIAAMRDENLATRNVIAVHRENMLQQAFAGATVFIPPLPSADPLPDEYGHLLRNSATMFLATPIRDQTQTVIAVLALRISLLQDFARIVRLGRIGQTGHTYGVDGEGVLLTELRFKRPDTTHQFISHMHVTDPGGDLTQGYIPPEAKEKWPPTMPVEAIIEGVNGVNLNGYRDYRGVEVFGAWRWDNALGFAVVTEIAKTEALAGFFKTRRIVWGLTALLLAFTTLILLLWFLLRLRKHSEELLRNSRARFAGIVEAAFDGIIGIDENGRIQSFNHAAENMFGWRAGEVIGKNVKLLMPPPYQQQHDEFIKRYLSTGERKIIGVTGRELMARRKSGVLFPMELRVSEIFIGEQRLFTGFVRDISEAKQMQDTLNEYRQHLENLVEQRTLELTLAKEEAEQARAIAETANKAKSEFLANMNHELRSPLNAILGYTQLLSHDEATMSIQGDAIRTIQQSAEHLLHMISELLDLAKIEAQKISLDIHRFDFQDFLNSVENLVAISAQQKHLQFKVETADYLPVTIEADKKRLHQVLLNLLNNAIKFTNSGKVCLCVAMPYSTDNMCQLRFEVSDTGIGIDEANLQHIFSAFFQAGSLENRALGTGLGLSICQALLKLMDSVLNVHSQVGHGSTFWFELNLPCSFEAYQEIDEVGAYHRIITYQGARRKILIADDVESNLKLMRTMLAPLGFELAQANNGRAALQKALDWQPDLIFIDFKMPLLNGEETVAELRRYDSLAATKIILVSGNVIATQAAKLAQNHYDDRLVKPIKLSELVSKIQQQLDLEWIYTDADKVEHTHATALLWPPATELLALRYAVQNGHTPKIKQLLGQLLAHDKRYQGFVSEIDRFMKKFEFEKILEFLAQGET